MTSIDDFIRTSSALFFFGQYPSVLFSQTTALDVPKLFRPWVDPPKVGLPNGPCIPVFNPSILCGIFVDVPSMCLVSVRTSNGPGCPGIELVSSESTKTLINSVYIGLLDVSESALVNAVELQVPVGFCDSKDEAGRLKEVRGIMDLRLKMVNATVYGIFYCEMNQQDFIFKGQGVGTVEVSFEGTRDSTSNVSTGLRIKEALLKDIRFVSPMDDVVEKNWQLIDDQRLILQRGIQPNVLGHINEHEIIFENHGLWPHDVIFGSTNVRGGFCCVRLDYHLLIGIGHMVRYRSGSSQGPFQTRIYTQFFYALNADSYETIGVSPEFCFATTSRFADTDSLCEAIQFASGLALIGEELIVTYGVNDCEAFISKLSVTDVVNFIRFFGIF